MTAQNNATSTQNVAASAEEQLASMEEIGSAKQARYLKWLKSCKD